MRKPLAYATPKPPRPVPAWMWMTTWLVIMGAMIVMGFFVVAWLFLGSGFGP